MAMYNDSSDSYENVDPAYIAGLELKVARLQGELAELKTSYEGVCNVNAAMNEVAPETRKRIQELESSEEELRRLHEFFIQRIPKMLEKEENPVSAAIELLALLNDVAPSIVSLIKQTFETIITGFKSAGVEWNGRQWVFAGYPDAEEKDEDLEQPK